MTAIEGFWLGIVTLWVFQWLFYLAGRQRQKNLGEEKMNLKLTNDLLCCPFCGASGDLRSDRSNPERPVWNVGCSKVDCIAHRPIFWQHDKHKVIDAWNSRII